MKKFFLSLALVCLSAISAMAVTITKEGGWFEAAFVEWAMESGATYEVYVAPTGSSSWTQLDSELVRSYGSFLRADAVGLKAGSYQLKVVSSTSGEKVTSALVVKAHDRSGFAHVGMPGGIGAYKNDGTLKDGAKVLYVHANNAKTVKTVVKIGSKDSNISECVGLQAIMDAYQKGYDTTPLDVRIIGTIKAANMDAFSSSSEGLQVKGRNEYSEMPITIEGIGEDAAISGFGILCRNSKSVEFRNFAIMLCMDDCLSLDTGNSNIWIHNMDFFYGSTGGDADQAKGDGTVDVKGKSMNCTLSYNHFYDAGKCSLGGMEGSTAENYCYHTYHHNWFDHSDSRHPRIRSQFFHVYNNYYDGVSKYGIGAAAGGASALVEANYFRNTKYPMLSSKQGTDAEGDGTFSGETGGVIKAFNNVIVNPRKIQYYDGQQTDGKWDAVLVTDRAASVSAKSFSGGYPYNAEGDKAARTTYVENQMDAPEDVPAIVTANAGRMNGGDITWTFNNSLQDENYAVIPELKSMLQTYKSTLVGLADGTAIANGGATERVDGGDGKGIDPDVNNAYVPSWAGGGGSIVSGKIVIGTDDDYFWFNEANKAKVNEYITAGVIAGGDVKPAQVIAASDGTKYSDYTGSIRLAQNGTLTFFHEKGIVSLDVYASGNGSQSWVISTSDDGQTFKSVGGEITGAKGAHPHVVYSGDPVKYVRITNKASGNRDLQGVKLYEEGEPVEDLRELSDLSVAEQSKTLNIGDTYKINYTTSSTGAVTFVSSKSSVAVVDASGNVTALNEGDVQITINQAADDYYKKGVASVLLTVQDPRAESSFELTSDGLVTIKEGETSQITTAGAAGTVLYTSNSTSVATVSSTGLITAVANGTATITVTDPGNSSTKGGSYNVTVTVIKDMTGVEFCHFTGKKPSETFVTESGSQWSTGNSFTYNGETYSDAAKINSKETVTITPPADCVVKLYFNADAVSTTVDGEMVTLAGGIYSFEATGGKAYVITKGNAKEAKLFIVELTPSQGGGGDPTPDPEPTSTKLIDYPTKTAGVNIMGSTEFSGSTVLLKNGYVGTVDGVANTPGNGIKLTVAGGFMAGDIVTIAGTISVKTSDASYAKKVATTAKLMTVEMAGQDPSVDDVLTEIYKFEPFGNVQETNVGNSGDQTYTLEATYPELWLIRDGGTTATLTKIIVERPSATGVSTLLNVVSTSALFDLQGRRVSQPVKGQMYILNGKKYIAK